MSTEAQREYQRNYQREWARKRRRDDPEYCERKREEARRKRAKDPEGAARRYRAWWLKDQYGLTLEDYDVMLVAQDGCCAICCAPAAGPTKLHVDHCHDTGKVRGLLCTCCNTALGKLREDPDVLRAALAYLEGSRAD